MPVAYRGVCVYKYYISSSGRNLRKLGLANALNFHFSVKSRITPKTGVTKGEEEEQAASGMQNLKNQTLPRTHRKSKRKLARLLSVCLSLGVCAPKNFCHELRLGKMCEKNISKQSKSDARAIENFSHRLAEGKSQKKVDKKIARGEEEEGTLGKLL